jgi:hypothetical protein
MKAWLEKFRISNAADGGRELPPNSTSAEARQFAATLREMERALQCDAPEVPASLHQNIMRAVRAEHRSARSPAATGWRWAVGFAAVGLVFLGISASVRWSHLPAPVGAPGSQLASVTLVLEQGQALPQTAPNVVLGPLSNEWELVHQDVRNAMTLLVASLP